MPNPTNVWHRTQQTGPTGSWQRRFGCGVFSMLTACADTTSGAIGPNDVTGNLFRSLQRDQVGGIDLYDGKVAAAKFDPFLDFTVFATYGPNRIDYPTLPRDFGPLRWAGFVAYIRSGRPARLDGDYDVLSDEFSCQPTYDDLHGICVPAYGWRNVAARGQPEILVSDPLCRWMKWLPEDMVKAYAGKLAGPGLVNTAVGPQRSRLAVSVAPGPFWRYFPDGDGGWRKRLGLTKGWTRPCAMPIGGMYGDRILSLVRVLEGPHTDTYLNVRETPIKTIWQSI